jgi:hypothetical protein
MILQFQRGDEIVVLKTAVGGVDHQYVHVGTGQKVLKVVEDTGTVRQPEAADVKSSRQKIDSTISFSLAELGLTQQQFLMDSMPAAIPMVLFLIHLSPIW